MKLFSVFDWKAREFGPIFEAKNEDVAIRQFKNMLSSERMLCPEDYSLYCFGEFDREKGEILPDINGETRVIVFSGESFLEIKNLEKKLDVEVGI